MKQLRKYQRKAFYYCNKVEHPALFLEMRLGKTLITIRNILKSKCNMEPILIVSPYSAFSGWFEELQSENIPKNEILELTGKQEERKLKVKNLKAWNIINTSGFLYLSNIAEVDWRTLIYDELTALKYVDTQRTAFFTEHFRGVPRRFGLTGTPMPESPLNIYEQLQYLDPNILGFNNYYEFRFNLFKRGQNRYKWYITDSGKKFLTERLSKYCFFMSRQEAGIGNFKIYEKRMIRLPADVTKIYETLEEEFILEVDNKILKVTEYAMTKFIWLRQLCGGYIVDENKSASFLHAEKIKEILYLMEGELKNNSVVIWCAYINEIIQLKRKLIKNNFSCLTIFGQIEKGERETRRRSFQNGNTQILICQPECFKYGSNLSKGDTALYYSTPLGLESRLQSEDRIIDVEKKSPDLILDLICKDTVEEDIYKGIQKKESIQKTMVSIIKRLKIKYGIS